MTQPSTIDRWTDLRASAEAAKHQLETGPKEWPGRPSAQRLAFFLAASPQTILDLLDQHEAALAELQRLREG